MYTTIYNLAPGNYPISFAQYVGVLYVSHRPVGPNNRVLRLYTFHHSITGKMYPFTISPAFFEIILNSEVGTYSQRFYYAQLIIEGIS